MNVIRVVFLLDASGSMSYKRGDVIPSVNAYFDTLRADQEKGKNAYEVSWLTFNTVTSAFTPPQLVSRIPRLEHDNYITIGNTALLDAIGKTLEELPKPSMEPTKYLVVIMTDGEENSSREYTRERIRDMIRMREMTTRWTFVYLACDVDGFAEAGSLGIARGNTANFDVGSTQTVMSGAAQGTIAYAAGAGYTDSFATDNLGKVAKTKRTPRPKRTRNAPDSKSR